MADEIPEVNPEKEGETAAPKPPEAEPEKEHEKVPEWGQRLIEKVDALASHKEEEETPIKPDVTPKRGPWHKR